MERLQTNPESLRYAASQSLPQSMGGENDILSQSSSKKETHLAKLIYQHRQHPSEDPNRGQVKYRDHRRFRPPIPIAFANALIRPDSHSLQRHSKHGYAERYAEHRMTTEMPAEGNNGHEYNCQKGCSTN